MAQQHLTRGAPGSWWGTVGAAGPAMRLSCLEPGCHLGAAETCGGTQPSFLVWWTVTLKSACHAGPPSSEEPGLWSSPPTGDLGQLLPWAGRAWLTHETLQATCEPHALHLMLANPIRTEETSSRQFFGTKFQPLGGVSVTGQPVKVSGSHLFSPFAHTLQAHQPRPA